MDSFVCAACDKTWERKPTRGRRPQFCPDCRVESRGHKLARCAWCDRKAFVRLDADCCSRQCAMNMRAKPSCEVPWHSCLVCMSWFTTTPHRYETCSPTCSSIAAEVMRVEQVRELPADRECPACAEMFTPAMPHSTFCGKRCALRMQRRRRRAREYGTYGEWRWSDFMRVARRFDYCCAYCGTRPTEQLDPDHVIALSRGGANVLSNLLPACRLCNSDKRDLTLDEWAVDRERRGSPARCTSWPEFDPRYFHLTSVRTVAA